MSIAADFSKNLSPHLTARRWLVAYSGGVDSSALLHLAVALSKQLNGPVVAALHINHGLSANADLWQQHCAQQCFHLGVEFIAQRVDVKPSGKGLEQAAREARYAIFSQHLGDNELLLQGHHQNDQAETLLFRLFRGAGVAGLAAIKLERTLGKGRLCRPCLSSSRAAIEAYVAEHQLVFIHDESNDSNDFDRNYIRHELLPRITQRWPQAVKTLAASADHAKEAVELLDNLAEIDLRATVKDGDQINLAALALLSNARQNNILRFWLAQAELVPTAAQLAQIKQQFLAAKADAVPQIIIANKALNRYGDRLFCGPVIDASELAKLEGYLWSGGEPLLLADGVYLSAEPVPSGGLDISGALRLSFKRSGKRFHPYSRNHSNSIKKLMQACEVLPWHRDSIPLLSIGGELAAIVGVGIDKRFVATKPKQGYRLCLTLCDHRYVCE